MNARKRVIKKLTSAKIINKRKNKRRFLASNSYKKNNGND